MTRVTIKLTVKSTEVAQGPFASMANQGMKFEGKDATIERNYDPGVQRIQLTIHGNTKSSCTYEVFDEAASVRTGSLKITEGSKATKVIRFYMKKRSV